MIYEWHFHGCVFEHSSGWKYDLYKKKSYHPNGSIYIPRYGHIDKNGIFTPLHLYKGFEPIPHEIIDTENEVIRRLCKLLSTHP